MNSPLSRRSFLKQTVSVSAAGLTLAGRPQLVSASEANVAPASGALPKGTIAGMSVSRLLIGGNLLTHFTHSRDLSYVYRLAAKYNTDEKIFQTLALAEAQGIDTLVIHTVPHILDLLRRYRRERGGKIKYIICPTAPVQSDLAAYRAQVEELAKDGVDAIYLWGVRADELAAQGKVDLIAKLVELGKAAGKPSGVGAHDLKVIELCEQHQVPADFYVKTFHHHNYPSAAKPEERSRVISEVPGYWCQDPQKVSAVMQQVQKPWIAFKVMAAGAIPPENAFRYAFNNGADHVLAGMFDFEIADDVRIAKEVLARCQRKRSWMS